MSLLDGARRLMAVDPFAHQESESTGTYSECVACGGENRQHAPDCPWLSMPKIVAVLEAAEAYVREMEGQGERVDILRRVRTYQALVAALKGEEVKA